MQYTVEADFWSPQRVACGNTKKTNMPVPVSEFVAPNF